MLFADLYFLYFFLPLCIGGYLLTKKTKYRNWLLVGFSLWFYIWGEPQRIVLLLASVLVNYMLALAIDRAKTPGGRKFFFILALVYDLGMLGVFKYADFAIGNLNALLGTSIVQPHISLPLGISFYTFQILSYVIDVYWEKVPVQKQLHKLLMYISLFPQLVAGPIVRYETIADEIDHRRVTVNEVGSGLMRLCVGLGKKVLLANNLNLIVAACFGQEVAAASVAGSWLGAVCYALQVYFDFSGYSDMAIGMGWIFGFHFDENFNYPFICRSVSEFWQRWHISLSTFFRDYLFYVPLFGKRRPTLSLFLVWFCTGLWHGASWNYVIWGLYYGVFLFIETRIGKKKLRAAPTWLMHLYNKLVIIVGFGIFKFENFADLGNFLKNLVGLNGNAFLDAAVRDAFTGNVFLILAAVIACFPILPAIRRALEKAPSGLRAMGRYTAMACSLLLLFACTAVLVDTFATNNPFLYWNF